MGKLSVALFVFNRPQYAKKVIDAIKKYQPKKLYVYCDGPRVQKFEEDSKHINEIKYYLGEKKFVNIEYRFSTSNSGCKKSIINGLDHFFSKEDFGVILEDDCVPELKFFDLCEYSNSTYSNSNNIQLVSGTNYLFQEIEDDKYFLSKMGAIWGWATWGHVWKGVTNNFDNIDKEELSKQISNWYNHEGYSQFIYKMIEGVIDGKLDAWSLYFLYDQIKNKRLSVVSENNLISNIGDEGTHAVIKSPFIKMATKNKLITSISLKNENNCDYDTIAMNNIINKELESLIKHEKSSFFQRIKDSFKYRIGRHLKN
tara:strand:+ start:529 stop:1467 length:939 start_codon:yes stop_codon:yes gene_type:complete